MGKHGNPYNEVLGYGRYGKPPKPLTQMSLREVYDWGQKVLRPNSGMNSSAVGAFQIVGKTIKAYMGKAGLGWDDKFSPQNQRKLADQIMRGQGTGAWEGFKSHPRERQLAKEAFARLTAAAPGTPGGPPGPSTDRVIGYKLKNQMTTAEINAWNAAHMPHGASLRDRAHGAHQARAAHGDPRYAGIKHLAGGGPVTPNEPHIVGENGPELFVPSRAGHVHPRVDSGLNIDIDSIKKENAIAIADAIAPARMSLLRGDHNRPGRFTIDSLMHSMDVWRRSRAEHMQALKKTRDRLLRDRQGEADTGGTGDYGFKWPGPIPGGQGIFPGHDIGRHHRGEQDPAWRPRGRNPGYGGYEPSEGYFSRDMWPHSPRMHRASLIDSARQAGLMEHKHTVTGDASISVDFKNMPRGVHPKASADGIFKEVKLNRGRAGAFANQEG